MRQTLTNFLAAFGLMTSAFINNGQAASLDGIAVDVANLSESVLCAEKDNITLTMSSSEVKSFKIEATHPSYLGAVVQDRYAPDWTACGELNEKSTNVPPVKRVTLFERVDIWLTGYVFQEFWRPSDVPFTVAGKTERNLSIIQLWVRRNERAEEVLVLYPADGYWRIRPLPPAHLGWSAYGSSHLIGPVEKDGRPLVKLKAVAFDPDKQEFALEFERGGSAIVKLGTLDQDRQILDVTFSEPVKDRPFAALRSMYVTEFNADVARLALREPDKQGWTEEMLLTSKGGKATDIWTGRLVPSRHNTSAPDLIFNAFGK
jgi:hypothetical protein